MCLNEWLNIKPEEIEEVSERNEKKIKGIKIKAERQLQKQEPKQLQR